MAIEGLGSINVDRHANKAQGYAARDMTAAELIRSARSRAGLAQHELARLLDTPRSQIGRWESGEVEPAFATVRRVLRACGFDLSTALVPFDPDAPQVARLTPKERLDAALVRGGSERKSYRFDPYAVLEGVDEVGVDYILVGSLARVLQGADEIPDEVDLVIPKGARFASDEAILTFAMRAFGVDRDGDAWSYRVPGALLRVREAPEGTKGHRGLRRRAERVHLGGGLRPWVASAGDLTRMMEALARPEQAAQLESMRRVVELDGGLRLER
jgi:transcriptional regulator with XRE-family HTH domain